MANKKKDPKRVERKVSAATNLTTNSVRGNLSYFKRKYTLTYRDEKPTVYKIQCIRGNVIKGDDIVAYAANAAHVPISTVRAAAKAFFDGITYYCAQGRCVQVPLLGSFEPATRVKTKQLVEDVTTDTIKQKRLKWNPSRAVQSLGRINNINLTENKSYTYLAIPEAKPQD